MWYKSVVRPMDLDFKPNWTSSVQIDLDMQISHLLIPSIASEICLYFTLFFIHVLWKIFYKLLLPSHW